jgi:MFS transporter, SHS family, lactate transporter
MGTIWAYQLFFLFFGPEMSQEERNEHEDSASFLEQMRKEGVSLAEIGAQRIKTHDTDGRVIVDSTHDLEKSRSGEHVEDSNEVEAKEVA